VSAFNGNMSHDSKCEIFLLGFIAQESFGFGVRVAQPMFGYFLLFCGIGV
jgi:hypothetical protein